MKNETLLKKIWACTDSVEWVKAGKYATKQAAWDAAYAAAAAARIKARKVCADIVRKYIPEVP